MAPTTVQINGSVYGGGSTTTGSITIRLVDSDGFPVIGRVDDGGTEQKIVGPYEATPGTPFSLVPNALITPAGTKYLAEFRLEGGNANARPTFYSELWTVPNVAGPIDFADLV